MFARLSPAVLFFVGLAASHSAHGAAATVIALRGHNFWEAEKVLLPLAVHQGGEWTYAPLQQISRRLSSDAPLTSEDGLLVCDMMKRTFHGLKDPYARFNPSATTLTNIIDSRYFALRGEGNTQVFLYRDFVLTDQRVRYTPPRRVSLEEQRDAIIAMAKEQLEGEARRIQQENQEQDGGVGPSEPAEPLRFLPETHLTPEISPAIPLLVQGRTAYWVEITWRSRQEPDEYSLQRLPEDSGLLSCVVDLSSPGRATVLWSDPQLHWHNLRQVLCAHDFDGDGTTELVIKEGAHEYRAFAVYSSSAKFAYGRVAVVSGAL